MLYGMATIILLTVGLIKKKTNERIFFETESFGGNVRVELNIPNYVTKTGLKTQQMLINKNLRKG